jgi:Patatin-like phospholipase
VRASERYPALTSAHLQASRPAKYPRLARDWDCFLRLLLVLWIVRAPFAMTLLGVALLGLTPQAQDLFMEFARTGHLRMLGFLLVLILIWAMPTHYAARLLLDTDRRFRLSLVRTPNGDERCSQVSALWVPRALGLLTFVAVLIAIWRSSINVPELNDPANTTAVYNALDEVTVLVVAGALVFFGYMLWRPRRAAIPILDLLKPVDRVLGPLWRRISPGLRAERDSDDEISRDTGRFLLAALFAGFVLVFFAGAENVARVFPRAMAVPFILGGWLPFLSYLSGVGRACRAPMILLFFGLIASATFVLGDNHGVRLVNAGKQAGDPTVDTKALPLENAVSLWKEANCRKNDPCPRPIIIAAAGGASRAAFFAATVLGRLLDDKQSRLSPDQIGNRLFAISGVSGGAVGAVMITTAFAETSNGAIQPCQSDSSPLWWRTDKVTSWRDCLEVLTSGDFLSADVLGFAFNDMLPFRLPFLRDRAAVMEDSLSAHYDQIIPPASNGRCHGLNCPFLSLRPTVAHWIPLLVLNGTSEATGGRIITTLLASTYNLPPQQCPTINDDDKCHIFVQAERFHDLLPNETALNDVRLSTAAMNSARFPLISPPGTIRNSDDQIVDRIVDGGYFENYGALSAKELALAIHAYDQTLFPLVIVISNDPDDLLSKKDDATRNLPPDNKLLMGQRNKAQTRISGPEPVTDLVTPIKTVINARTAHGLLAVAELDSALRGAIAPVSCENLIQVRVWPEEANASGESKAVSMSWWLSTPVQEHLHNQTEPQQAPQATDNMPHLVAILEQLGSKSTCEQAPKP